MTYSPKYLETITTLDELHEVGRQRKLCKTENKPYLLFQKYFLPKDGGVFVVDDRYYLDKGLAKVVDTDAATAVFEDFTVSYSYKQFPISADKCSVCDESFTVDSAASSWQIRDTHKFSHARCVQRLNTKRNRQEFEKVFNEICLTGADLVEIPDGYDSKDPYRSSWFEAYILPDIKLSFGWRRSVISVQLLESPREVDIAKLFPKEDVTKDTTYIHAWSYEKMLEYVKVIVAAARGQL